MWNTKKIKLLAFAVLVIISIWGIGGMMFCRSQLCMGVRVVSEYVLENRTEDPYMDIAELLFNGQNIGSGQELTTIYISQPAEAIGDSSELQGALTVSDPNLSLAFIEDNSIHDIEKSVQTSTPLQLIITNETVYRRIGVIITTLPVLYLEQTSLNVGIDNQGRELISGRFTICGEPKGSSFGYCVDSGMTLWHVRGASSSLLPKKPLKLELKNSYGQKTDHNLLGLGSDDDWILNPMSRDDTKVREKTAMDFWNQFISSQKPQTKMSAGEYVEVILNNEYYGLFLLQRRIDQKYLQLNREDDILIKGLNVWEADTLFNGYEVVFSSVDWKDNYRILADILSAQGNNRIDVDNFIEITVFLNFLSAADNTGYKNMFYVLQKVDEYYVMKLIPWDTDMSMGIIEGFSYNYDYSLDYRSQRMEYEQMETPYPKLDEMISVYWQRSRKDIYSEELIQQLLNSNMSVVCNSGAYFRDMQEWGLCNDGKDTQEALTQWCMDRLNILDQWYAGS